MLRFLLHRSNWGVSMLIKWGSDIDFCHVFPDTNLLEVRCVQIWLIFFLLYLKNRIEGQDKQEVEQKKNLHEELEERERRHFSSKGKSYNGKKNQTNLSSSRVIFHCNYIYCCFYVYSLEKFLLFTYCFIHCFRW